MKGQFFVLGAILLASLFFAGLPITGYLISTVSDDLNYISDNIVNEFPKALNTILDNNDIERLGDFSTFLDSQITQRNAVFKNLWIVTEGEGSNVNVTVGNYLDEDITIVFNISDTIEMIFMPAGTVDSVEFSGVAQQFTLRATFPGVDNELQFQRNKVNLYSFFSLSRGENILRQEIIA